MLSCISRSFPSGFFLWLALSQSNIRTLTILWIEMEDTPRQERNSWSPVGNIYVKMKERDQLLSYLFGWGSWALITVLDLKKERFFRGERLFKAGCLLNIHHFVQVLSLFCYNIINNNETR